MHHKDLIRYSTLLVVLGAHAATSDGAARWNYLSTAETVNLSAWVTVLGAIYGVVAQVACSRKVMKNPPPLTADTVYVYVYGLGLLIFVATYSGLGCNLNSTFAFATGTAGVCIDDILALRSESRMRRLMWAWCVLMSVGAVSTFWFDREHNTLFEKQVDLGSVFEIVYGLVMPALIPFLFHMIRAPPPQANGAATLFSPRVGPTVIIELLHMGMPLAVIVSSMPVFTMGIPRSLNIASATLANFTASPDLSLDGSNALEPALLMALLPLTTGAWLFFLVQSVLLYRTTEFLVIWCLVSATRHSLHDMTSLASQGGCVLAFKALVTLLCLGQMGTPDMVKMEQTREYTEEDDENHIVLLYQPEPQQTPE